MVLCPDGMVPGVGPLWMARRVGWTPYGEDATEPSVRARVGRPRDPELVRNHQG